MSFAYANALHYLMQGRFNHRESGTEAGSAAAMDCRAILLMSNTDANVDVGQTHIADITTLGEYDGAGYSRATLLGQGLTPDLTPRTFFHANDFDFGAIGAGSFPAVAVLLVSWMTSDADSHVLYYLTIAPFVGTGIVVPFHDDDVNGFVYLTLAA